MNLDTPEDDGAERTYAEILAEVEGQLAAVVRQYRRAWEADDAVALALEDEEVVRWVRRLITLHQDFHNDRNGVAALDWIWPVRDTEWNVELTASEMSVSGRILCGLLVEGKRLEWTEPYAARIVQQDDGWELADYTFWWGARETATDLRTVERRVRSGETLNPPAPAHDDGWAFIFRRGEANGPDAVGIDLG